jgi:hypothetical protein
MSNNTVSEVKEDKTMELTLSNKNIVGFEFLEAKENDGREEVLLVLKEGEPLRHVVFTPDEFFNLFSSIFVMNKDKLGMKSERLGLIFQVDKDTPTYNYLLKTNSQIQTLISDYDALSEIVPDEKRSQYHLIFGGEIMASANTQEEIINLQDTEFKNILCKVFYPDIAKLDS